MEQTTALTHPARLNALYDTALLDTPPEEGFDRLTRLATRVLRVPAAMIVLVDAERQFIKSMFGLIAPWTTHHGLPQENPFCQQVVNTGAPLIIADIRCTPLPCDNLAIVGLGVHAYAGYPLRTTDGQVLGSFCTIDTQPRDWTADDLATLRDLADVAANEIALRLSEGRLRQIAQRQAIEQAAVQLLATAHGLHDAALPLLELIGTELDWAVTELWLPDSGGGTLR